MAVEMSAPIAVVAQKFRCSHIKLRVQPAEKPAVEAGKTNAFAKMMGAQQQQHCKLPEPYKGAAMDDALFNDLLSFCRARNIGWSTVDAAKGFIDALRKLLWYIDPHRAKLEKELHTTLPAEFDPKNLHQWAADFTGAKVYNDLQRKQKGKVELDCSQLNALTLVLNGYRSHVWWQQAKFAEIVQPTIKLVDICACYVKQLESAAARMREVHQQRLQAFSPREQIRWQELCCCCY